MFWQNNKEFDFFDECLAILDFLRKWLLIDNINSCILGATRGFARKKPLVKFVPSALSKHYFFCGLV